MSTGKLKVDITSLAIGVGIGVAILTVVIILYILPFGKGVILEFEDAALSKEDNAQFWMFGLIKEINPQMMIIDQTFGASPLQDGTNNPAVQVKLGKGTAFVNCHQGSESYPSPEECIMTLTPERLTKGVHVCALVSIYGDGAMYAGKIWLDSSCGPFDRNLTSLVAEGITIGGQYLVQVSWDLDQTIYGNGTDLSISIRDSETLEPLKQVTYDFSYKGLSELGGFQDKYVEDFSSPQVLRTGIRNPCAMHLTIHIDKVGDQSFLRTDPQEIEKDGNTSSVFIQFRTFPDNELVGCDGNNIKLLLFNGYDLEGNRVPSEKS